MSDLNDKPSQRCCLGILYYSQAMEQEGKRPVCLGFPHTPTEPVQLPDQKQLAEPMEYKFMCLGHSLYERHTAAGQPGRSSAEPQQPVRGRLPYCEGLEVIMGTTLEAAAASTAAAAAEGAHQAKATSQQQPDELSAVLSTIFGGEDSPLVKGAARKYSSMKQSRQSLNDGRSAVFGGEDSPVVRGASRFNKIATRNWERMKATASQAYSMTIKQLIDKLSDQ